MRGKVAKRIRKAIFGNFSFYEKKEYEPGHEPQRMKVVQKDKSDDDVNKVVSFISNPTVLLAGRRKFYRQAKVAYKRNISFTI